MEKQIKEWLESYRPVRQQTVRSETTKGKYGALPPPVYAVQLTSNKSARGEGSHVACLKFKRSRVGALTMFHVALTVAVGNLKKGCRLSRFHFKCCHYLLGHVACQNLDFDSMNKNKGYH